MTAALPPELWLQIVFLLPLQTLGSFKMVCRAFKSLVLTRQLMALDLSLEFTNVEHLRKQLKWRLGIASENPLLVRVLRLRSANHPHPMVKSRHRFWGVKHLFQRFRSQSTFDLDSQLIQLIPRLTQVRELQIVDRKQPISGTNQSLQLMWKTFSSTLTTLSVRLSTTVATTRCLPPIEGGMPALPLLKTLKLQYYSYCVPRDPDLWGTINSLTSQSPLLEEVQYEFGRYVPRQGPAMWFPTDSTIHPNLRVFKWISLQTDSRGPSPHSIKTCPGFQTFLRTLAGHLRVLHIDAFNSQSFWEGTDLLSLTELRLDLYCCDILQDTSTFSKISQMSTLTILEICGRWPEQDKLYQLLPIRRFSENYTCP